MAYFVDFTYSVNWVSTGSMCIDMDAWFEVAYKRGWGFTYKKNSKLISLIEQDVKATYKVLQYTYAHRKSNEKLADLISKRLDPFYETSGNSADV